MRSDSLKRAVLLVLSALLLVAIVAAPAGASEPIEVELSTSTHATSFAPAADGTVWFSLYHGSEWEGRKGPTLGRLGADGTVTELPAPEGGPPALGPDGELWVSGARKDGAGEVRFDVAQLSSSGQLVKRYPVGRGKGGLVPGIEALTPTAGAVWFVRHRPRRRAAIERLSLADGSVRQFSLHPGCGSNALAIAADGTVWFTESCGHRGGNMRGPEGSAIGKITPGGRGVRYRVTGRGHPVSVAVGTDRTVWFGMTNLGYTTPLVGHITSTGGLAEYRVPNGEPSSIAVGGDGRLWFPSSFGGGTDRALDSIGPSGRLAEPVCADPTCRLGPSALTAAPDGSLWYALTEPHSIGGGGFTQIMEGETIQNEAGFIGHVVP
jgi:streptogramin lyase